MHVSKRVSLACVFLLLLAALIPADTVTANLPTCGPSENNFAGYGGYVWLPTNWNETPEGARSTLRVRYPLMCPGLDYPYSFSTSWVMVYNQASAGGYAQSGYMRTRNDPNGDCMRHFAEYKRVSADAHTRWINWTSCATAGADYDYRVEFIGPAGPYPGSGYLRMQVGALTMINAPFNPWGNGWSFAVAYMGETDHRGNDVPGYSGAVANFQNLQIQSIDNGLWRSTPAYLRGTEVGGYGPGYYRYQRNASSSTNAWIWTDPV